MGDIDTLCTAVGAFLARWHAAVLAPLSALGFESAAHSDGRARAARVAQRTIGPLIISRLEADFCLWRRVWGAARAREAGSGGRTGRFLERSLMNG